MTPQSSEHESPFLNRIHSAVNQNHRREVSKSDLKVSNAKISESMRKNVTRIDESALTYEVYFGWKVHEHLVKK